MVWAGTPLSAKVRPSVREEAAEEGVSATPGHRLRRISGHTGGQQSCHSAAACQQQGGLGQRHHRDGGQGVQTEEVPQLPAQRLLGQAGCPAAAAGGLRRQNRSRR